MNREEIIKEKFEIYAKDNKYLYDALCSCYENGVETYACCAGTKSDELPYFGIVIKKESLDSIRNIIANLQDMKDISMEYIVRLDENNEMLKNGKGKGFIIRGTLNNRCEMFYKISEGIKHQQKYPKTSMKAELFYRGLEKFYNMDEKEIQSIMEDDRIANEVYTNNSDELKEYYKQIYKNVHNPIITKLSQVFTKKGKEEKERFQKLDKMYKTPQVEYIPSLKQTIKESTAYDEETFDTEKHEEKENIEDVNNNGLNKINADENEK